MLCGAQQRMGTLKEGWAVSLVGGLKRVSMEKTSEDIAKELKLPGHVELASPGWSSQRPEGLTGQEQLSPPCIALLSLKVAEAAGWHHLPRNSPCWCPSLRVQLFPVDFVDCMLLRHPVCVAPARDPESDSHPWAKLWSLQSH